MFFCIKLETEWFDIFPRMLFVRILCQENHVIADELNRMCWFNLDDSLDRIYDKMPKLLEQYE